MISFIRKARNASDFTVMAVNFTPVPRPLYRIGVPDAGWYREVLNSDAGIYGGSNLGNAGGVHTEPVPSHGYDQSIVLVLPPLAFVMFKRT